MKFGGGKVIRDGMAQGQSTRANGAVYAVITNALIVDVTGIYKADIDQKYGLISAIGKAGNPDVQPGVDIIIGPGSEVIAEEGKVITAGGFDSHIHFICPQQIEEALTSGIGGKIAIATYLNAFLSNLIWVCVRLVPLGQSDGLAIIAKLEKEIVNQAEKVAGSTLDDLGSSALVSDITSIAHEHMSTRIFRS
ncbi:MAG: hypothetical protein GY742_09000 [Hyphomicrobiales bacterium]|nr:hypothetical protein [Hyphomicrobiales bacterium]